MKTFKEYTLLVNEAIDRLDIEGSPRELFDPIRYTMEAGGKRVRPVLTLAVADALNSGDFSPAIPAALATEMFHNFTLLHDDIMDESTTRRGRPTVWTRWNEPTAILAGDAMLTFAGSIPLQSELPAEIKIAVLNCFNQVAMDVYRGQQMDMNFESSDSVTLNDYLEMIRLKTAVLIAGACLMGAISVDAPDEAMKAFFSYGLNIGLAFQLCDDLLDTFGDAITFGKPIGGDIANDKKTWLYLTALQEAPEAMARIAADCLGEREKIEAVTEVYRSLDLPRRGNEMIEAYTQRAINALREIALSDEAMDFFIEAANSLVKRIN